MTSRTIIIGLLVVLVVLVGGFWVSNSQRHDDCQSANSQTLLDNAPDSPDDSAVVPDLVDCE